ISMTDPQSVSGPLKAAYAYYWSQGALNSGLSSSEANRLCLQSGREALRRQPGNPYASDAVASCLTQIAMQPQLTSPIVDSLLDEGITLLEPVIAAHPTFLWGRIELGLLYNIKAGLYISRKPEVAKKLIVEKAIPVY